MHAVKTRGVHVRKADTCDAWTARSLHVSTVRSVCARDETCFAGRLLGAAEAPDRRILRRRRIVSGPAQGLRGPCGREAREARTHAPARNGVPSVPLPRHVTRVARCAHRVVSCRVPPGSVAWRGAAAKVCGPEPRQTLPLVAASGVLRTLRRFIL